jgi:prepilin-type N-terminal cleavage/methylation domain-containing protein
MSRCRHGLTLVEVLVALTLVVVQVPAVVATVAAAAELTRRAQGVVAAIDPDTAATRCVAP